VEGGGVVANADTCPSLKAGAEALHDHITYPEAAAADGIEGKVFVQFVVTKDGGVTQAEVKRGPHPALNEEALRVVKSLRFAPARKDGR
jgi:protein TonB